METYGVAEDCYETVWNDLYEGNARTTLSEKHYYTSTENFNNLHALLEKANEQYENNQESYVEYINLK